ncbi:MAG: dephospho-CoA kinase [Planctomycetia bacterium]|nr:MAG: dephospho-CoA kinase [Planctomycetia bacterium]
MEERKKPIVGLCGAIGAGKSRVAAALGALGCVVVDSDRLNHEVLRRPEVLAQLRSWWGPEVVTPDGQPDRRRIAEIVFSDGREKQRLESLVHPLIDALRADRIRQAVGDPAVPAVVLDSPLLLESQLDRICDSILFVDASAGVRLARLRATRGWDAAQMESRERWQLPPEAKRARADFVIVNEGTEEELQSAVAAVLRDVLHR